MVMETRRRSSPISDRVEVFLDQHPHTEFPIDAIARSTNLSEKQTKSALRHLKMYGVAEFGSMRGYWKRTDRPVNPVQVTTAPAVTAAPVSSNGTSAIAEQDVLEVLRVRQGGEVVLIDTNGELWVAKHIDI